MKKSFLIIILILQGTFSFSLTLQKTIPANSTYGGINVQENLNELIYKILAPNLKSSLYPNGLNASGVQAIIAGLKKLDVKDIEFFTNNDWNILVKINSPRFTEITQLFAGLLDGEGFMTQINKIDANNTTITSKNPELSENTFILRQEKKYILLTTKKAALSAWDTKSTLVNLYTKALTAIKAPNVFGFLYGIDSVYSSNKATFITLNSNENVDFLNITMINKNTSPNISFPTFFKDNPIMFFTSTEDLNAQKIASLKNILASAYAFLPSFRLPINILLSPAANPKRLAIEFVDGNLVNINEKKYNELDMAFSFQFNDATKIETLLKKQLKSNKIVDFTVQASKNQEIFIITPKIPEDKAKSLGLLPVYMLLNSDGMLAMSMNKDTILQLATNMSNVKKTLKINKKDNSSILFANINMLIDRFPILNSLMSQFGIDIKAIKTITAPNDFTKIDDEYISNRIQILFN